MFTSARIDADAKGRRIPVLGVISEHVRLENSSDFLFH
jgi:hypothetical protein